MKDGGGTKKPKPSKIRKPRKSGPVMEAMKKGEFLSPHPFHPSQREQIKTNRSRLLAKPRLNELGDDLEAEEVS